MAPLNQDSNPLADLPLLPRDEDGPTFVEPWQAQAFAVVVELIDSEKVSREEWADRLGSELKEAEERGEYDSAVRYYDHWLAALEKLVVDKNLAEWNDLIGEKEEIRDNDHHRREHQLGDGH
jgi:nitrile hydratase accessory protein